MFRNNVNVSRRFTRFVAAFIAAISIGLGVFGIDRAVSSGGSSTAATVPAATQGAASGGGGSNARSGPAAGGSIGTVSDLSSSGFTLVTSAGQKVTVKQTSSTTYENGQATASATAVGNGDTALVLGTDDNTTLTANEVIVNPVTPNAQTASQVVAFTQGAGDTSKTVGQIPSSYKPGTGTIVSGTTADKATEAALATYPGGIVDRVVQLSNGQYEVHNMGVSWPHHIYVNAEFQVIGAN